MRGLLAKLIFATAQRQSQFVLQLVKVDKFLLNIAQLFLQPAPHRSAWLQAIPSEAQ